jgi:hypothetical protein
MNNNIEFVSSIKIESDFEELVRRFVQKLFGAEAYLVGGPYDGGRDLVYAIRGREKREAMQISIQEKALEKKIDADLAKVEKLVDEHAYPSTLYFFWSHALTASREDSIKTDARIKHGITLEIYDAKKIAQKITNDYPDILRYLIEKIHSYSPSASADTDIKERALYEYLALSKDTVNLKNVIVESQIVSSLYGERRSKADLLVFVMDLGVKEGKAKAMISGLLQKGRVQEISSDIVLSSSEVDRIRNIETKEVSRKAEVLKTISNTLKKYTKENLAEEVLSLIKETYAASIEVQISEINLDPPRLSLIKQSAQEIGRLLVSRGKISELDSIKATHELVSSAAGNEYLADYCSSRLCISLLNQRKLENYVASKRFFLYLDAPVLIRYLVLSRFSDERYLDGALKTVKTLKESIKHLKHKEIRATVEHFEETVRHLEHAEKISRFASDELIAALGESKNIFFNTYLRCKKAKSPTYAFHNFLDDLIGLESSKGASRISFELLLTYSQKFLELSGVTISTDAAPVDERSMDELLSRYRQFTGKQRKTQTIRNDLIACNILATNDFHLDDKGIGQTPLLITWDSTQHELRTLFRQKYRFGEWYIYTPQRAIERLSMVDLSIQSVTLKDSVLAIIDEDYFKDSKNSLIDTLEIFLGEDPMETGAVCSLLTKLTQRLTNEAADGHHADLDGHNTLNEVLIYTQHEFRIEFAKVRRLFADDRFRSQVFDLLSTASASKFDEIERALYSSKLQELLANVDSISHL